MALLASRSKPEGFYDPIAAAEREEAAQGGDADEEDGEEAESRPRRGLLSFSNTDMAFAGDMLFEGNYHGFNTYRVEVPASPQLISSVVCPGGQGDVSVIGNLLIMSVEQTRGRLDCGLQGVPETVSDERFRGLRIFDISDMRQPRQVAAVQTCRGSHTHTLVGDPDDDGNVYVYGSGTGPVRSGEELEGCSDESPAENPETSLFRIDVIQIPLANPEEARVVSRPFVFRDPETGDVAGLWRGGDHGPGTQRTSETSRCHDITAYPDIGLAAGACSGNGILFDISDPINPVRVDEVVDPGFAYWHSATFNNDGTKVIFTDEWGGGGRARCRASDPRNWGANAIYDIVDGQLEYRSHYKLPAPQGETENCVAHNGSLVPVPGRDIMVQGWYQGGISVFDFTDSTNPVEIAYFDRGPLDPERISMAGYWSAYWYRGFVYGTEIARGLDVLELLPSEFLTENEITAASVVAPATFNAQDQRRIDWPARPVVGLAYLDQLERTDTLAAGRRSALSALLDRANTALAGAGDAGAGRRAAGRGRGGAGGGRRGQRAERGAAGRAGRQPDQRRRGVALTSVGSLPRLLVGGATAALVSAGSGAAAGQTSVCDDVRIVLRLTTDDYGHETGWSLTNGRSEVVSSGTGYDDATVNVETLCLPAGQYVFEITDSYGDGICCDYGHGAYAIDAAGETLVAGGRFGSLEAKAFSLADAPAWGPYYADARGLTGFALKTALHEIISPHEMRGYRGLWRFYRDRSLDAYYENDGTVLDIYSENPHGPDPYSYAPTDDQCGTYRAEGDCYNREHLFARGWFGRPREPMNSDVHHIFATDGRVNQQRGSLPFAEVDPGAADFVSRSGSRRGPARADVGYDGIVFEPIDEFKGDVARAFFYVATRYEDRIAGWEDRAPEADAILDGSRGRVFESWFLAVLLRWHADDPVSPRERDRNEAAHEYQRNRNPFVDHPDMVSLIWGPE